MDNELERLNRLFGENNKRWEDITYRHAYTLFLLWELAEERTESVRRLIDSSRKLLDEYPLWFSADELESAVKKCEAIWT